MNTHGAPTEIRLVLGPPRSRLPPPEKMPGEGAINRTPQKYDREACWVRARIANNWTAEQKALAALGKK